MYISCIGYIYAIGGINETGPQSSVERFNLSKERWRLITPLDKPVYNHAATTHAAQVILLYAISSCASIFLIVICSGGLNLTNVPKMLIFLLPYLLWYQNVHVYMIWRIGEALSTIYI